MTLFQYDAKDSGSQTLTGYVEVKLDAPIVDDLTGTAYMPKPRRFTFVNGGIGFTLTPTEDDRVTYYFRVVGTEEYTPEPTEDDPTPDPVTLETLYDEFHAMVPDVAGTMKLTDLQRQTLATQDAQDASLLTILRRMTTSPEFWQAANTNLFKVKGIYNPVASYTMGDVVNFDGSAYVNVSLLALVNQSPTQYPAGWRLLVSKGDTGSGTTGSTTPYNAGIWVDNVAPARVAVKDIIETLETKAVVATKAPTASPAFTGNPTRSTDPLLTDRSSQLATTNWVQTLLDVVRKATCPVGMLANFAYLSAPTGWLPCDGRKLLRVDYPALFTVLSTTWNTGGETGTEFRLPDFRGRTVQTVDDFGTAAGAAGRLTSANSLAASGGSQSKALAIAELPPHTHTIAEKINSFTATGLASGSTAYFAVVSAGFAGASNITVNNTGSGTAFSIMQPYAVATTHIYTGL